MQLTNNIFFFDFSDKIIGNSIIFLYLCRDFGVLCNAVTFLCLMEIFF